MLSRLRMSVRECLEIFKRISSELFERERRISVFGFLRPKYSKYDLAADVFESIFLQRIADFNRHKHKKFSSPPDLCQT
jgi:hypothetical protein